MLRIGSIMVGLAMVLGLSGCSLFGSSSTGFTLTINAVDQINPDAHNRPSPVMVSVYQLAAGGTFDKLDFFQLYDKEGTVLGPDLVDKQQLTIGPGETKVLKLDLKPTAKRVAIVCAYRDIDHARWRTSIGIPSDGSGKYVVIVDKLAVSVAADKS
jgi:type VI secretion system protein VasD